MADKPTWEMYSTCIHCGLCLNHCPTYRVLGTEMDSPRGRIYQVLQVDNGRLAIGDSFATHIDRCLGCLACETACPSGVQYGHIVERARAQIELHYKRPWLARLMRAFFFKKVLRDYRLLARCARALRFYQRFGIQKVVRASGVLKLLGMEKLEALAPAVDDEFFFSEFGTLVPAVGERRACVAFHAGCIGNITHSDLNRATVRLLVKNGVEVYILARQRCCGALDAHAGFREDACLLARRNIKAFFDESREVDALITNTAGCGAHLKQYHDLLKDDAKYAARAAEFAGKVMDVTEFLAAIGLRQPVHKLEQRVTYQDPCHLAHAQRIRSAPRELLVAAGARLIEMPNSEQCCGSAGTYNVMQNELSMRILEAKMNDVASVSADILATANIGCMMQLQAGIAQRGLKLPVRHVIELLNDCY